VSAKPPKEARPKVKAWPSMLGVQHAADAILEETITFRSPRREGKARPNLTGWSAKQKVESRLLNKIKIFSCDIACYLRKWINIPVTSKMMVAP